MDVMAGSNSVATTTTAMFGGLSIVPQTNGVLKRHKTYHGGGETVYKECLKNHAASMGGHAVDGCGEFMPSQMATATDPRSLTCAACGCHRNFHRRDTAVGAAHVIEYHPQHRHLPLPPPQLAAGAGVEEGSPVSDDESPPPISSTYYPGSAPQMLLALSSGGGDGEDEPNKRGASEAVFSSALTTTPPPLSKADENTRIDINNNYNLSNSGGANLPYMTGRKRFRTKFSQDQKERMHEFAEKVGWKLQRSNDEVVKGFCNEIGVQREVFKVWMHNNKNTLGRRSGGTNYVISGAHDSNNQGGISLNHPIIKEDYEVVNGNGNGIGVGNSNSSSISEQHHHQLFNHRTTSAPAPTNASSSSS